MRKTLLKALPMLFVGLLFALQSIRAQTNYYVDAATGNDANAGTQASPKKTIQAAVDVATGTSIIYISVGSYAENVTIAKSNISLIGSGSGANGNSAPTAPSAASHTIITGGGAGKGIQVSGSRTNVTVRDLAVIGYTEEGFFASSGASNLAVQNLQVNGNCTGNAGRGGIFVAGNALNVTITGNAVQNNGPGATARGIALWDNSKDKITITNNYVVFTSCCGIDLNDGTSSGVNISNNTLIAGSAGSDSGIGVLGMKAGNGANIISGNNITIAKRYGIEIKNPAGSGLDDESADGAIIVKNNIITRSGAFTELSDIAGIAVFRRSFTPGNPSNYIDVPSGVVIKGNTIDGFTQASAEGEGYGIVVEGVRMTIKDNIISNSDIGIQRQAGNSSGYVKNNAGDANQAAAASPYFDRGNSPFSASIILSGNTLTSGNGTQTRDEFAANSYLGDAQFVFNADKKANYATINLGVEYATAGNTLQLSEHTFDELVIVNKSLTIDGVDKTTRKLTYTGVELHPSNSGIGFNTTMTTPALFKVTAQNVTIKNLSMDVDLAKISSAIITSGVAGGLAVTDNNITAVASGALYGPYGFRNAIASNISGLGMLGVVNDGNPSGVITVQRNTISHTPAGINPLAGFRAAIAVDGYNVLVENNTTSAVNHDVTNRFQTTPGQSIVRGNTFNGGGVEFSEPNASFGGALFENNVFDYAYPQTLLSALVRFKNNNANKPFVFKNNQVKNHYWLVSLENFQNVEIDGNTFDPAVFNSALPALSGNNGYFQIISINTKTISSSNNTKLPLSATITNNTFNGVNSSVNSKGIAFYNHDNNSPQFGEFTIGSIGKLNTFGNNITNYIYLDNSNNVVSNDASMTKYPEYGGNISQTNTGYWAIDIRADQNRFFIDGEPRTVASLSQTQRNTLDGKIYDKLDDANVGKVNYYFPVKNITSGLNYATIQSAIDAATAGDEIKVDAGTYAEKIIVNKRLTIKGPNVGVAGSATRQAEAKIVPHVTDLGNTSASLVQFILGSDGSVFDGFEVNGNNSALTSGQVSKGEDIDAPLGVRIMNAGKITIQNNVVRNFMSTAPTPFAYGIYSSVPTVVTNAYSEIVIKDNYVGNVQTSAAAAYTGILLVNSYYAQISGNKVEDVRTAIQLNNFSLANPTPSFEPSVSNNEIIATRGLYYNLFYGTASPWKITGNNISSASIANGSAAWFAGIRLETLQSSFTGGAEISNNIIDGKSTARLGENAAFDGTGLWFNNEITTPGVILVKDNNIGFVNNGILYNADNYSLTNNVKYVGGNIHDVVNNYVKYATAGTPVFSNIDLTTTELDGKTGGQYTSAELADIYTNKIIDKDDNAVFGKVTLFFNVTNVTRSTAFADIQSAIDDAATQAGDIIDVSNGTLTLTTAVNINKSIALRGNFNTLNAKPIIKGVGNASNMALFEVNAPNVTVSNFEFQIEQTGNAMVGISSTSTDNFNNVTISDNVFKGMKAQSTGMVFESYAIKLGRLSSGLALPKNQVNVLRNVVNYNNMAAPDLFGRGVYAYNVYGKIGGSATDGNTIAAFYALQSGQVGGSADFEFSNNNVQGGVVAIIGADAGNHKIANNDIGSGILLKAQADLLARHLEVRGTRGVSTTIEVSGNTIRNYTNIGAFVQRSNNVTLTGNTFTPFQDNTNDKFSSIVFSSKEGTSSSQSAVMSENLTITANTFNGNASNAGTAIAFWNHNGSGAIKPLMNAKIGGSDTDKNTFSSALGNYITLDATASGTTSSLSAVYGVAQDLTNTTNILPFNSDIDASYNVFGAINTGTETNFNNLLSVKGSIADGIDNPLTGYVNIQPNKAFIGATALLGNALTAVPENFTLVLKNDATVYGALGDATVNKAFTFDIDNNVAAEMVFGNLIVNALAKQVTFADKAKATGNFTLTEGKINAPSGFVLDATKAISFTVSKPNNYVNGTVTLNGLGAGASETILVGNATTSTAVALTDPTGTTPSNFEITYTGSAPANGTNFNAAVVGVVHNKEFWTITKTGGDIAAKVGLTTFDFTNSGFTSFAPADALMVRFDGTNWVSVGNDGYSVNASVGTMTSASTTDFGNFTFAKTPLAVLPISLISFSAQATNGGALVKWSTAKEENNATFEVEKSLDGRNFFIIHTKAGKGDASTVSNYEFLDASFKQSAYYRLVDVDASGKRNPHTALTKFVKGLDNSLSVVAYPNPVTTKLFVSVGSANKENVKVSLVDLTGKTLKTKTADSSQPIELDVAGVATGSYILQVIKDSGNVSKKIVKL
jgi:hypothetical protein